MECSIAICVLRIYICAVLSKLFQDGYMPK